MGHIKKALEESSDDLEEAKIWLKKKGFKDAENRMSRSANTKLYAIKQCKSGANKVNVVNLSCETDFVACTDIFQNFLKELVDGNVKDIQDGLKQIIAKTQENCIVNLNTSLDYTSSNKDNTFIGVYLHNSPTPGVGSKGAVVVLTIPSTDNSYKPDEPTKNILNDLAHNLAMQVVACNPKYTNPESIPKEVKDKELSIIKDGLIQEKKPNVDKIAEIKLKNFFDEITLTEQEHVIISHEEISEGGNQKMKVKEFLDKKWKELKLPGLKIIDFKLYV